MNRGKTSGHELLEDVDKRLQELENSNCEDKDNLYMKSKDAIYHVFFACKTQMAIFGGKLGDDVKEV